MGDVRRPSRRFLGGALAVAVVAVVAAGCGGGGDDDEAGGGRDLTELRCPLEQVDGGEYRPAEKSFDTAELIGDRVEEARATAADHGCQVVVSIRDGEGVPVPTDVDPTRIYVYTENGVVTEIEGVGGGI